MLSFSATVIGTSGENFPSSSVSNPFMTAYSALSLSVTSAASVNE